MNETSENAGDGNEGPGDPAHAEGENRVFAEGISITPHRVDIYGRAYIISHILDVAVEYTIHPEYKYLNTIYSSTAPVALILILWIISGDMRGHDPRHDHASDIPYVVSYVIMIALPLLIWAKYNRDRLPPWGRLIFRLSSGSVEVFEGRRDIAEGIADSLRQTMKSKTDDTGSA
jgi:hypothetical protein